MNIMWRALFFGLCLQVGAIIIGGLLGISPFLVQTDMDMKNPDEIVKTWSWGGTGSVVGDIGAGLRFFWDINIPFIESIIIIAKNAGCPNVILDPFKIIWRFIWNTFAIDMIWGRRIAYD